MRTRVQSRRRPPAGVGLTRRVPRPGPGGRERTLGQQIGPSRTGPDPPCSSPTMSSFASPRGTVNSSSRETPTPRRPLRPTHSSSFWVTSGCLSVRFHGWDFSGLKS